MSTNNIGFYEDLTKIFFQLSSNMHLISSSVTYVLGRASHKYLAQKYCFKLCRLFFLKFSFLVYIYNVKIEVSLLFLETEHICQIGVNF